MDFKQIIESIRHLEFINNLDNSINKLLYSADFGYINFTSKEALLNFEKYISKFDSECEKISSNTRTPNKDKIIEIKKKEYLTQIKKHFETQTLNWAQEIYQNRIENCLFQAAINKTNQAKLDEIYSNALCAISWIVEVNFLDEANKKTLIDNFNLEFEFALKSNDSNLLAEPNPKTSSFKRFMELFNLIQKDSGEFLNHNLDFENSFLTKEDLASFKQKQADLLTFKKTNVLDEISLINFALENLNLKKDEQKYQFIKEVENDFNLFISNNKKLDETNKIEIIKRRMNLFYKKDKQDYYKKVLEV